ASCASDRGRNWRIISLKRVPRRTSLRWPPGGSPTDPALIFRLAVGVLPPRRLPDQTRAPHHVADTGLRLGFGRRGLVVHADTSIPLALDLRSPAIADATYAASSPTPRS